MGYRPDPMLSALANYRKGDASKQTFRGVIAVLTCWESRGAAHSPLHRRMFRGLRSRAEASGFLLQEFPLPDWADCPERLGALLADRGIEGVLIPPGPAEGFRLDMDLSRFCPVSSTHTLLSPHVHRVTSDFHANVWLAFKTLWWRGYRNIAFVTPEKSDARAGFRWSGAFHSACLRSGISAPARAVDIRSGQRKESASPVVRKGPTRRDPLARRPATPPPPLGSLHRYPRRPGPRDPQPAARGRGSKRYRPVPGDAGGSGDRRSRIAHPPPGIRHTGKPADDPGPRHMGRRKHRAPSGGLLKRLRPNDRRTAPPASGGFSSRLPHAPGKKRSTRPQRPLPAFPCPDRHCRPAGGR